MRKKHPFLIATLAALLGANVLTGCNSRANEEEDVQEAAQKLEGEKRDLAKED